MAKKSINFKQDTDYNISALQSRITRDQSVAAAVRKEYTKLRDIAQKRLGRMSKSEFSQSDTFKEYKQGFKKLKDIDQKDLAEAFHQLQKFVGSKKSSISGQREMQQKTIQTLQEQGLKINRKNYWPTIGILREMRSRKIIYGSDKAIELAEFFLSRDKNMTSKNEINSFLSDMSTDNLSAMLSHTSQLGQIPDNAYTAVDMSKYIEKLGW